MPSVFISAGETSGDLNSARLVDEMMARQPGLAFLGIGGDEMKAAGVELLYHIDQMGILGFAEAVRHIGFARRVLKQIHARLRRRQPDLVILVDYPGFNLRLARIASELSIPVLYYIAPQIWAWGAGRIRTMARYVDNVAVIFPFETALYRQAGMNVAFVGHPLLERLNPALDRDTFLDQNDFDPAKPLIGLLPGSRQKEIERLLPVMLKSAALVRKNINDAQFVIAASSASSVSQIQPLLYHHRSNIPVLQGRTLEIMSCSHVLLIASGTATLEAACFGTPSLLLYKVSLLSYLIARIVLRIPRIGLVNIIANKEIVPEILQSRATPERVAADTLSLLKDVERRRFMQSGFREVREKLGEPGASAKTAEIALDLINRVHKTTTDHGSAG